MSDKSKDAKLFIIHSDSDPFLERLHYLIDNCAEWDADNFFVDQLYRNLYEAYLWYDILIQDEIAREEGDEKDGD